MDRPVRKPDPNHLPDPPQVILETRAIRKEFYDTIRPLICFDDWEWDLFLLETVEWLADYETAYANILECSHQVRTQFEGSYPDEIAAKVGEALRVFMVQLFEYLERIKAYEDGAFNWAAWDFLHGDMRLYRIE
jgi:hypothetical protein